MKKIFSLTIVVIMITTITMTFVSCSRNKIQENETVIVYSYSGENEQFSLNNGIIILSKEQDIIYGGELYVKDEKITDIVSETMELYVVSNNSKIPLTSFSSTSNSGLDLNNPGSITTKIAEDEKKNLVENLYFKLSIENLSGEKNVYDIKMNVVDILAN